MKPKNKAKELTDKYIKYTPVKFDFENARQCALIAVDEIINSNPHSNPLNTELYSTMGYWIEVKNEILTIKSK
jgi:hypothetical protein